VSVGRRWAEEALGGEGECGEEQAQARRRRSIVRRNERARRSRSE